MGEKNLKHFTKYLIYTGYTGFEQHKASPRSFLSTSETHPSSRLFGEGLHHVADAVFGHYRVVKHKLVVAVNLTLDLKVVGHQRVPVIQSVEFGCNAVLVLETLIEEKLWVKLELEVVATQMLNIVLDHNFDGLTWEKKSRII